MAFSNANFFRFSARLNKIRRLKPLPQFCQIFIWVRQGSSKTSGLALTQYVINVKNNQTWRKALGYQWRQQQEQKPQGDCSHNWIKRRYWNLILSMKYPFYAFYLLSHRMCLLTHDDVTLSRPDFLFSTWNDILNNIGTSMSHLKHCHVDFGDQDWGYM